MGLKDAAGAGKIGMNLADRVAPLGVDSADEMRRILGYTVSAKGCPPSLAQIFLAKTVMV